MAEGKAEKIKEQLLDGVIFLIAVLFLLLFMKFFSKAKLRQAHVLPEKY